MTKRAPTVPCPIGCGRNHSIQFLLCRPCWAMVPRDLQRAIYATVRTRGPEYEKAKETALAIVTTKRRTRSMKEALS